MLSSYLHIRLPSGFSGIPTAAINANLTGTSIRSSWSVEVIRCVTSPFAPFVRLILKYYVTKFMEPSSPSGAKSR
jgi:hypothetical protein